MLHRPDVRPGCLVGPPTRVPLVAGLCFLLHATLPPRSHVLTLYSSQMDKWELKLDQLVALNDVFKEQFADWYRNAPQEYQCDVFHSAVPVGFVIRYGQDRPVQGTDGVSSRTFWMEEFDLTVLHTVELALATHYRCSSLPRSCVA